MDESIRLQKQTLRKKIKELKSQYSLSELLRKSELIFNLLDQLDEVKKANTILAYWSLDDEVYTHNWIKSNYKQKKILLPAIFKNNLLIKPFEGEENMISVPPFGIKEPKSTEITDLSIIDIIIVPGVAFDKIGYRLGRGKGYYDRFLTKTKAIKIGICFDFQIVEKVPINQFDIKIDIIITENNIYSFG